MRCFCGCNQSNIPFEMERVWQPHARDAMATAKVYTEISDLTVINYSSYYQSFKLTHKNIIIPIADAYSQFLYCKVS